MRILFKKKFTRCSIAIGCIVLTSLSCARKVPPDNIPQELKNAWLTHLKQEPNYDSTKVRFEVKDVVYYTEKTMYVCKFKVRMQVPSKNIDTVGIMGGNVSKDFATVHRKY